ncbi:MAG: sugar transferase [Microthrixaceae bacterium]
MKITEAGTLLGGRSTSGSRSTIGDGAGTELIDLRSTDTVPSSAEPTQHTVIPRRDRRAMGRFVNLFGHALDGLAVGLPFLLSSFANDNAEGGKVATAVIVLFAVVVTIMLWPTHRRGRHLIAPSEGLVSLVSRLGLATLVTWSIISGVDYIMREGATRQIDAVAILQIVVLTFPLVLIGRVVSYRLGTQARKRGYDLEDTLIVGSGPTGVEIAEALLDNPEVGLVPSGFVDRFDSDSDLPTVGHPEDLPTILASSGVRNVVIAFGGVPETELVSIVRRCHGLGVHFFVVPRLFELGVSAGDLGHEVDGLPLVKVTTPDQRAWRAKRMFDIVTSTILLILVSPVMIACAIAVKLTSRGPVFFHQVRVGIGGKPFDILKFRTMRENDDSSTQWSVDDDDRVTMVGKVLRPSHLDELPQLINVLRGDMSLVGPRPERPHFVEQFSAEVEGYEYRHRVPVGITGWAQVNGYWGDTSIERRARLDNRYIENWSIWRDLVIALRTLPTLFGKRR